ncbi:DNA repair exonuclease [Halobacillus sp. Nhm2S1]|uniref:metallophosphoesterase family protein n=1 Tax=Halobacillus sp. Nhm2S1 TaxID=2866716 RepID=UPI001C72E0C4|nr:DNA repair exonuclease [Halobacillus sp. Nhm2S1]MBX0357207.1 DNA repair exonuclease [Halobacillus sp. Nhm2S1]
MVASSIRFIHSADLHIDSLFKTKGNFPGELLEKLRKSTFEAFDRLIDACINHKVDFLLITGDLYNEEIRSIKAQVHLRRGFERLQEKGIHVYISYGNHDYIEGKTLPIEMPGNVHIFESQNVEHFPFEKEGKVLAHIYGFSYETREVRDRKVQDFNKVEGADYHIGMLHGSLDTNTDHDVYAPFSLEELKGKGMDYWALGHIHKRSVLSTDPPVLYPGNIQGRSRKEAGEKGCYLVEHTRGEWKYHLVPLQSITYVSTSVSDLESTTFEELEEILENAKDKVAAGSPIMLTITMVGYAGPIEDIQEWVEVINGNEDFHSDDWIWIEEIRVESRTTWDEEELMKGSHFTGELLRTISDLHDEEVKQWLSPLFSHRKISKYIQPIKGEETTDIVEQAKSLLLDKMITHERGRTM